jgi:tRNA(Ile)-lysidine synthase
MISLIDRFHQSMKSFGIQPETKVVLGISGGIDSTVLLHLAFEYGLELIVAHVNYMLRDEDSLEDERFVKHLAHSYKADFQVLNAANLFDGESGESIQMQARSIRRNWFEQLLKDKIAKVILLGHHADDQAETFFIRMLRGQGILGLASMDQYSGCYLRPMLKFRRHEITEFALNAGLTWREDTSNDSDKYLRNKIRHHLLPAVDLVHGQGVQSIINSVERLNSERSIYLNFLSTFEKSHKKLNKTGFSIEKKHILSFEKPAPLIHYLLRETGFSYALCSQIAQNLTNTSYLWYSNANWKAHLDRAYLTVNQIFNNVSVDSKSEKNTIDIKEVVKLNDIPLLINRLNAIIDPDTILETLTLRTWQKGDRFWPTGMKGSKLLSDYFTDLKFSEEEKSKQLILCSGNDIVWLVNQRVDRRFAYNQSSKSAWLVSIL